MPYAFPPNALLLAPMVELTHRPLRELIESFGDCDVYYTEMSSAAAYVSGAAWDRYFLDTLPRPDRTVLQFYATERESMAKAAKLSASIDALGIDLNFGCSAPHIEKSGGGVRWMKDPAGAADLVKAARDARPEGTLSVKTRAGYEDDYGFLLDFCGRLVEAGADWIALHPRLKSEKFRRSGRWDYVKLLGEDLGVPVVGNGDIRSPEDWAYRHENAGNCPIMIGREAVRRPWIFDLIKQRIADPAYAPRVDLRDVAFRMLDLIAALLPPEFHRSRGRRFFFYYADNFTFGHHVRTKTRHADTLDEFRAILDSYFAEVPSDAARIETPPAQA